MEKAGKWIGLVVAAIGFVSAILTFQSKLTINTAETFSPSDPFAIPFDFINDGPLPIYYEQHSFEIYSIVYKDGSAVKDLRAFPVFPRKHLYRPGEGTTVFCYFPEINDKPVQMLDIGLKILYRPVWFPIELSHERRYLIAYDLTGKLRTIMKPLSN